ncbi:MAG: hypothetical protein WCB62_18175, partial [Pseudolabrys sp.]
MALILSISFVSRPVTIVVALAVAHSGAKSRWPRSNYDAAGAGCCCEHAVCGGGERSLISVTMLRWRRKVPQQAVPWP